MPKPFNRLSVVAISLVAVAAVVFFLIPRITSKTPAAQAIDPAFAQYIASYQAGAVSSDSRIRIVLSLDVVDSAEVGKEASATLFDFIPSIPGKSVWLDRRTIEFQPSSRLTSGQVYQVRFRLSRLIQNLPAELKSFVYAFQVFPQNFEWRMVNIKPVIKNDLTKQQIEGNFITADFADGVAVEKSLNAYQADKQLAVTWTHSADGRQHQFVVNGVVRKEEPGTVTFRVDGKPLGVDMVEEQEVDIPALGDFKVLDVRVEQGSSQHVVIQFSDPLNESQNLEGLIALSGLTDLDFEIRENLVNVYPKARQSGTLTLSVEAGVKNVLDFRMATAHTEILTFEQVNPAVRFAGKGNILPGSEGLVLPFEAVNLKAVDVQIVKIFEHNVLQFFQVNDMDGNQELRRVGKPVLSKMISLENAGVVDLGRWNRFTLDLATLIQAEPGAIYQVRIGFRKSYSTYTCGQAVDETLTSISTIESDEDYNGELENNYWDSYESYYYDEDYNWRERDNPCHPSYYTRERTIRRNVLASDLGLIAKRGEDGNTWITVTDIKTALPRSGVKVALFDYQNQLLGEASTDAEGRANISSQGLPFMLVATDATQRGYLRLSDGESLSLSNFDVGGEKVDRGIKGFIYGERGVWRPGDTLHLTFLLQDRQKLIPDTHPVVLELYNPQSQLVTRVVRSSGENGFYTFQPTTAADAPTGNWRAKAKVGGAEFTQTVKIETVKPNRLKINLDFGVEKIVAGKSNLSGKLSVNWLHGAPGRNLRAQFEVLLTRGETKFKKYPTYQFEDPTREFNTETQQVFDGQVDDQGNATINATLNIEGNPPGVVNAVFRGKAFEESGNFSVDQFTIPFYPYTSFTGIRLPKGDQARQMLLTDTTHTVDVVTVDAEGTPVSRSEVQMSLYKIQWRWWWDNSGEGTVNYMSGEYAQPLSKGVIKTVNGKGTWQFKVKHPEWGRFMVKAYDPVSGHSTAKVVYIDWPGWAGRARREADGATMLSFSAAKPSYTVGEKATLTIPGSGDGRALISIENGSRLLASYWLDTRQGDNTFNFDVTTAMAPNIFVNVTLLQPHAQTLNDLPLRMYGVIPLAVEDPTSRLQPVIDMPDVLEPGKPVTIKVTEAQKRKMTYTLAVVDEGLLDLTRFKTPDPWSRFYTREALGVKTWDVFDEVMGAYGGRLEHLLAIGGSDLLINKEADAKANRFKPVVKFFGPYTIDGEAGKHQFTMPQYVGSVKTMLVAGYEGAYGKAEKVTPVRKPLMVLATLPRVLGPEEKVKLPVTIFASGKARGNVNVSVTVNDLLTLPSATRTVNVTQGEVTVDFDIAAKAVTGVARVEVKATANNFSATDAIDLEIRNPNPRISAVTEHLLESGQTWNTSVVPLGIAGTNVATLEVSSLPPINLANRMHYLLQYPYGCVEQTTSAAFPQLYIGNFKPLSDEEKAMIQRNVKTGIDALRTFALPDGSFGYWPGAGNGDNWGTSYAGHFLIEAQAAGYVVSAELLRKWKKYQRNKAQQWRKSEYTENSTLMQAYRLYTLALSGDAELGAMNRLREQQSLETTATWMLAAAYAKAGQPEAAKALVARESTKIIPYKEMGYSYGSQLRDEAVILETLVMLNDRGKAFQLVKNISASLSDPSYWMSTQTTAWCLKAVAGFAAGERKGDLKFTYTYGGKETNVNTQLPMAQVGLPQNASKSLPVRVTSATSGSLFVRLIREGVPARGAEEDASNNLTLSVSYTDLQGKAIDVSTLRQGQEFVASVTVSNPSTRANYANLALQQILPSGWEVNNLRLQGAEARLSSAEPTYQDIRDDRVYTYFDLPARLNKTFKVLLTASYAGAYYLPAVSCEAMYDNSIYARVKGQEVKVEKSTVQ